jgi:hypothetical protein
MFFVLVTTGTSALSSKPHDDAKASILRLRAAMESSNTAINNEKAVVTFICGSEKYWDFLENILFSQSTWKTKSTTSVYVCDAFHMKICQRHQQAYSHIGCKLQSLGDLPQINVFKTAAILEAMSAETATHLLFLDVDMAFQRDIWVDVEPYMLFDLAFSSQGQSDQYLDINIGAVLVRRSLKTFEFWEKVYDTILSTRRWDQEVVSDLAWENESGVKHALFPRRIITAFGFGYPINSSGTQYESAAALHAVCLTAKWLLLKEVGFWSDVNGYYSKALTIRLEMRDSALDAYQVSAFLAASIKVATECSRKVVLPDNLPVRGQVLRFCELWDLRRLADVRAPVLEPSFDRHAARVQGTIPTHAHPERYHQSHFILNGEFAKNPPCSDTSRTWILTPDTSFLAAKLEAPVGVIVDEKKPPLFHCPTKGTQQRIPCQVAETDFQYCDHNNVTLSYPL